MTLDEAIKHAEEVADKKEREKQKWERWLEHDSDNRAVAEKESCDLCAKEHRQLAEWLKELKQLREQTSWTPVSEGLPKKSEKYFVTVLDGVNKRTTIVHYHQMSKSWTLTGRRAYWKVTAWMPRPKPYKEESEGRHEI